MSGWVEIVAGIALVGTIVGVSYLFTGWWISKFYRACGDCRSLNVPRRTHCRVCGRSFEGEPFGGK